MDKGRAIIEYTMAKRRTKQGSGELLDPERPYFEACRLIELNAWQDEAEEYYLQDREELYKKLEPIAEEYYSFLMSGDSNEEEKLRYQSLLQEYDINGELALRVEYRASHNNIEPSQEELESLLKQREERGRMYRDNFFEEQTKIALGEPFSTDKLLEATKYLRRMNLYNVALKMLPDAINREILRRNKEWEFTVEHLPKIPIYY